MALLGVDIGTTGTKAVLFSESGEILNSDYQEYPHIYPKPSWAELNPDKLWQAVQKTINQVCTRCKSPIKALCISCMGDNLVPIRKDGTPNYNGILCFDNRSIEEVKIVRDTIGEYNYFQTTGSPLTTSANLCKILWLRRNQPELFQTTWKFLTFADYVLLKMGFAPQIDYSMASRNIFDIRRLQYPQEILQEFGLTADIFSEPVPSGHVLGEIPVATRNQLGLPKGVKVIAGGIDLAFGVLGAGVSSQTLDKVADVAGTFEHAAYIRKKPILTKRAFECKVTSCCNVLRDSYLVYRGLATAGAAVRWFRNEFAQEENMEALREGQNVYDIMFRPLEFRGGDVIAIPYFAGSWINSHAKATITGLTLATQRRDILQALIEGITHELRTNIETIENLGKNRLGVIRCVGGAARSKKWLQLKSDITGRIVETVSMQEASTLGAAILAGLATGLYSSIDDAIKNTVRLTNSFSPRRELFEIYNMQHKTYKKLAQTICHS